MSPRVMTGALYLCLWVLLAFAGGWLLCVATAAMAVIALLELKVVASRRRMRLATEVAYPVAVGFVMAAYRFAGDLEDYGLALLALIFLLVMVDFAIHAQQGLRAPTACVSLTVFGAIYCGLLLSAVVLLRGYQPDVLAPTRFGWWPMGRRLLFFVLAVTMVSDVAAYVVGKAFGRHKLSSTVSPNKTIEGCIGAVVAGVLTSFLAGWVFNVGLTPTVADGAGAIWWANLGHRLVLGILIGAFGQVGDFGASIFKREAEVKDYGRLFPGHGGMLDRLDTLMVNAPLVYLYVLCAL